MTVVYHGQPSEEKELEFFVGETNPKGRTNPNTTSYAQSKGTPNMNTIDNTKGKTLCIVHPRRCRTLSSPSKHPLTSLAYV